MKLSEKVNWRNRKDMSGKYGIWTKERIDIVWSRMCDHSTNKELMIKTLQYVLDHCPDETFCSISFPRTMYEYLLRCYYIFYENEDIKRNAVKFHKLIINQVDGFKEEFRKTKEYHENKKKG